MIQGSQSSLRHKTISGIIWAGIGQFGSLAIHYGALLVLAGLLSPSDFGLVGLAMIFILFTQVIGELGLGMALIQQKAVTEPLLSTIFWANLSTSLLLAVITVTNADRISLFLGDLSAASLLRILAVAFPISAMALIPRALLEKKLAFQKLTLREFGGKIAFSLVGLALAIGGAGVWSLVGATLAQRLADTIILWIAVPWRPKLVFDLASMQNALPFGLSTMIAAILAQSISNIDYFVVGKWLGTEALGYYTLAFQLAVIPQQRLIGVLRKVAFPAFSIIQDDLNRLKSGFLEGLKHLFAGLVPSSLFLVTLAPWFIEAVYGDKWLPAVTILQILAIAGLFYGFDISEAIYFAVGRPKIRIWIIGLRLIFFSIFAISFGLSFGTSGIAISLTLAVAMTSFIGFVAVARILHITRRELLKPFLPTIRALLFACIPFAIFSFFPKSAFSPWIILIGLGSVMGLIYVLAIASVYKFSLSRLYDFRFGKR